MIETKAPTFSEDGTTSMFTLHYSVMKVGRYYATSTRACIFIRSTYCIFRNCITNAALLYNPSSKMDNFHFKKFIKCFIHDFCHYFTYFKICLFFKMYGNLHPLLLEKMCIYAYVTAEHGSTLKGGCKSSPPGRLSCKLKDTSGAFLNHLINMSILRVAEIPNFIQSLIHRDVSCSKSASMIMPPR